MIKINDLIPVFLLLKGEQNGGDYAKIPSKLLGELATKICQDGHCHVTTTGGNYVAVGFVVYGKETGERVIMLGTD